MKILDKNKDYYDYYGSTIDSTDLPIFDRRKSILINNLIFESDDIPSYTLTQKLNRVDVYILLTVGYTKFLFKDSFTVSIKPNSWDYDIKDTKFTFIKKFENVPLGKFRENETLLNICQVSLPNWYSQKYRDLYGYKKNKAYKIDCSAVEEKVALYDLNIPRNPLIVELPILVNTQIPKFITPKEMWVNLENYLTSVDNDKDINIETNKDKIINHGFDFKTSFRNM